MKCPTHNHSKSHDSYSVIKLKRLSKVMEKLDWAFWSVLGPLDDFQTDSHTLPVKGWGG